MLMRGAGRMLITGAGAPTATNDQVQAGEHAAPVRLTGFACAHPGGRVDFPLSVGSPFNNGGPFLMQSDRKSRLITICMLAGAVVMIGLVLTGTLQIRVSHSPIAYVVTK